MARASSMPLPSRGSSLHGRATTGTVRASEATPESKLALLEILSECDELGMCARAALAWLDVKGAIVVGVELEDSRLITLASHGDGLPAPGEVLVELDGKDHPLVRALSASRTSEVPAQALGHSYAPLGPLAPVPLIGDTVGC